MPTRARATCASESAVTSKLATCDAPRSHGHDHPGRRRLVVPLHHDTRAFVRGEHQGRVETSSGEQRIPGEIVGDDDERRFAATEDREIGGEHLEAGGVGRRIALARHRGRQSPRRPGSGAESSVGIDVRQKVVRRLALVSRDQRPHVTRLQRTLGPRLGPPVADDQLAQVVGRARAPTPRPRRPAVCTMVSRAQCSVRRSFPGCA